MTPAERAARAASWIVAALVAVYLMTPIIVTLLVSFTSSSVYTLPPPAWSAKWYAALADKDGLADSLMLSLNLALVSTAISLVLGTMTALAVSRGRFRGREAIATFSVSPLMMPGLVVGVALLQFFRDMGLRDAYVTLTLAHVVVTLPYVLRTLLAAFGSFDYTLIDAARTLGMPYLQAVVRVMVPALSPAFLTAGLFGFLASMDNYPISIFLTDARNKTLPVKMLQYMEESPDPSIAAISSGLILLALVALMLGSRTVGLNRMIQG
jgi:putative spermidine/putrescine transport system permease protein